MTTFQKIRPDFKPFVERITSITVSGDALPPCFEIFAKIAASGWEFCKGKFPTLRTFI